MEVTFIDVFFGADSESVNHPHASLTSFVCKIPLQPLCQARATLGYLVYNNEVWSRDMPVKRKFDCLGLQFIVNVRVTVKFRVQVPPFALTSLSRNQHLLNYTDRFSFTFNCHPVRVTLFFQGSF